MKKIFLFLTVSLIFSACQQKKDRGDIIVVGKGVEIPITTCVETNKKIFGKSVDATKFCKCLIPKLYEKLKNDPEKVNFLEEGNWDQLSNDNQELVREYYQDCIAEASTGDTASKIHFTPRMIEKMKTQMKAKLIGSDIEQTNDVTKYCDCIVARMEDFSAAEIMSQNFNETDKFKKMQTKCLESTRKK